MTQKFTIGKFDIILNLRLHDFQGKQLKFENKYLIILCTDTAV